MVAGVRVTGAFIACWLVACGGGTPEAESAEQEKLSPGEQCVRDAEVAREAPLEAPERIDVAHILIKHAGVKGAIGDDITRTREEACLRALKAREELLAEGDWDGAYEKYSDSKGATQGTLYNVTQGDLDANFAGAAFSLEVDELSYVVETDRGFHIIVRKK